MKLGKVKHPVFGEGIVVDTKYRGWYLEVEFPKVGRVLIPRAHVKFVEYVPGVEARKEVRIKPVISGDFKARWMIEAFRLGIVPHDYVNDFTFGRDKEIKFITEKIEKEDHGVILIEGQYGQGKTHLLDYIGIWAREKGFAVGRAMLDPQDVALWRPKNVYREIVQSLEVKIGNKILNFRDLMRKAKDIVNFQKPHTFLTPFFKELKKRGDDELLWNWIEGEEIPRDYLDSKGMKLKVLLNYRPTADLYCYLLTGLNFIMRQMGIEKFIILLDEAETIFHHDYREEQRIGSDFLRGLIGVARCKEELTKCEREEIKKDKSRLLGKMDSEGYLHSGVNPHPYIYQLPVTIHLIIALTPVDTWWYQEVVENVPEDCIIRLQNPPKSEYKKLIRKLISIYERAYEGFKLTDDKRKIVETKYLDYAETLGLRHIIKAVTENLDFIRHDTGTTPQ